MTQKVDPKLLTISRVYLTGKVNNHRLEGGGFKGCQLEIDCRREEARHPGSLCTPLPSRPLCFLNSPPDILGPRSAGPKTSSSGEQTPEGVLGSLFLLATARSYSGPGVVGRIRTRGRGRVQPYPRLCAAHVPSRSDESDRAHEPLLDRSKPFYDISVSKRCALLGPFRVRSVPVVTHATTIPRSSLRLKARGFDHPRKRH